MPKKAIYLDVETTGLDCTKHEIIQLSGMIVLNGKVAEEFDYKVRPIELENIDGTILSMQSRTIEEIANYPESKIVYQQFVELLGKHVDKFDKTDKFYPVGYNVDFDLNFLQYFFKLNGDNYLGSWINWRKIDVLNLVYFLDYLGLLNLENYKLGTVCKSYDIDLEAHNALNDIKCTRSLLHRLHKQFFHKLLK